MLIQNDDQGFGFPDMVLNLNIYYYLYALKFEGRMRGGGKWNKRLKIILSCIHTSYIMLLYYYV